LFSHATDNGESGNASILKKIRKLIEAITQSPFEGIGKPEALKYNLTGCWSRRINKEHRIVYEVFDDKIIVHSLKGHY
jgi:toxin YoeB